MTYTEMTMMFEKISSWAESSSILLETRKNADETSVLKEVLLFIVAYCLIIWLNRYVLPDFYYNPNHPYTEYILMNLFSYAVEIILVLLFVTKIEKRSLRSIGITKDHVPSSILKGLSIGFLMFLAVIAIGIILGEYSFKGIDATSLHLAVPFLLGFFIQSSAEEIELRGWTNTYFSKRHAIIVGFLVSELLFALTHLLNDGLDIISVCNILIAGLLFTVMFWKYDNIWICSSAHAMWNYAQGYLFGFNVSGVETANFLIFKQNSQSIIGGGVFGPESGLIATFVMMAAIAVVLYLPKKS